MLQIILAVLIEWTEVSHEDEISKGKYWHSYVLCCALLCTAGCAATGSFGYLH
jgi:hypothetical protein